MDVMVATGVTLGLAKEAPLTISGRNEYFYRIPYYTNALLIRINPNQTAPIGSLGRQIVTAVE
jgi:hypothetical protein